MNIAAAVAVQKDRELDGTTKTLLWVLSCRATEFNLDVRATPAEVAEDMAASRATLWRATERAEKLGRLSVEKTVGKPWVWHLACSKSRRPTSRFATNDVANRDNPPSLLFGLKEGGRAAARRRHPAAVALVEEPPPSAPVELCPEPVVREGLQAGRQALRMAR